MKLEDMLLYSSFRQLAGISEKKEQNLWRNNIHNLSELQDIYHAQQSLFENRETDVDHCIASLRDGDLTPFFLGLEKKNYYRIAYSFPDDVMFLDIETTGLSPQYHYITMVGWMKQGQYHYWIQGTDSSELIDAVTRAKLLVTFNGIMFDCKFLDSAFNTHVFSSKPNIDLMHLCRRYDLKGGQKVIERNLKFSRPKSLKETDGKEAIALWYDFIFGNTKALKSLIEYNFYDIQGMTFIMDWIFFKKIRGKEFPQCGDPQRFYSKLPLKSLDIPDEQTCKLIRDYVKGTISNFPRNNLKTSFSYNIVGIDLAGKVESRTGLCFLRGNQAITEVAHVNEDIFSFIAKTKPDIISIDAPLSLPKGRTSVYDDDPSRKECGILRYCERELKRRNINSYPALIRSMQELTKRGIQLAAHFRSLGIPVIECFPGAAQDVVQLPRKRTDESLLKRGLYEFGLRGPFETEKVCHDELDAITAALVAQFYISGYYEALGIPEENNMIIPQKTVNNSGRRCVIGVAGSNSLMRSKIAKYIESFGFAYIRLDSQCCDTINSDTVASSHSNRPDFNQELYKDYPCVVVDNIRSKEDYTFWKEECFTNFHIIFLSEQSIEESFIFNKADVIIKLYECDDFRVQVYNALMRFK